MARMTMLMQVHHQNRCTTLAGNLCTFLSTLLVNLKLFEKSKFLKKKDGEKIKTEIIEEEMKENESKKEKPA